VLSFFSCAGVVNMEPMNTGNKNTILKDHLIGIICRTVCKLRQSMFLIPDELLFKGKTTDSVFPQVSALPPAAADNIE
jgi:hypothetical protein